MCQFITAFLPGSADLSAAAATFERHHFGFTRIDNPHVLAQVPPGEVFVLTTRGHCDCGTPLGSQARSHPDDPGAVEHWSGKLRKRGWSEAKVRRWQEQKHRGEEKRLRDEQAHAANSTPRLTQWITFIGEILRSGQTTQVGLLLHSGHDIEEGRIGIERQEWVGLEDVTLTQPLHIQEDVLYRYRL